MKYQFQVYNNVYGYWECDTDCATANEVMQLMILYSSFDQVTRYRRLA